MNFVLVVRMCMVLTEEDEDMGEDTTFENLPVSLLGFNKTSYFYLA